MSEIICKLVNMRIKKYQCKHISTHDILLFQSYYNSNPKVYQCALEVLTSFPFSFPEKVVLCKMEKLENKGLLEVGVSLRCSYLTDKGKELLSSFVNVKD